MSGHDYRQCNLERNLEKTGGLISDQRRELRLMIRSNRPSFLHLKATVFGKIFTQIFDSSIAENYEMRLVFQDMIVLADVNGVVDMTPEALARRTNVPLDLVKKSLARLEAPDPKSRTPDHNGIRIKRLDDHRDWGWVIVNYQTFRQIASEEQRRVKTLERVHKHRSGSKLDDCNAPVTLCNAVKRSETLGNACNATETETDKQRERKMYKAEPIKANRLGASYSELMQRALDLIGKKDMQQSGFRFDQLCRQQPGKFQRVLEDTELAQREGRIKKSPGAYFNETWKHFQ